MPASAMKSLPSYGASARGPVLHQSASIPPTHRKRMTCSTNATRLCSNVKRRLGLVMKMSRLNEAR
jgi:hypothetical protein